MESITMLETVKGSPDGVSVYWYRSGREYPEEGAPMSGELREVFLREGWAVESDTFGDDPAQETEGEVATEAVCGVMTSRGTPCQMPRPCRFHSDD